MAAIGATSARLIKLPYRPGMALPDGVSVIEVTVGRRQRFSRAFWKLVETLSRAPCFAPSRPGPADPAVIKLGEAIGRLAARQLFAAMRGGTA